MSLAASLRQEIAAGRFVVAPGAYDCVTAKLIESAGFGAVYMSGGCTAGMLGFPDYGLATMTEMGKSGRPWDGETGLIGESLVKRVCHDLAAPIFYVVGPPAMVEAMRGTLNQTGINDDDIRSEEFYGY